MQRTMMTATAAAIFATPAMASSITFFSAVDGQQLGYTSSDRVEARFKADTTNWTMRLSDAPQPFVGDNLLNSGNGRSTFEGRSFGFSLAFDSVAKELSWTITNDAGNASALTYDASAPGSTPNLVQIATSGSRGTVVLDSAAFSSPSEASVAIPSLSVGPAGPTYAETFAFFGDSADLYAGDWSLAGFVSFDDFTHNNPNEGVKLSMSLRSAAVIPAPATALVFLPVAGLAMRRRR
ncbi:MAG: hypothetical protein JJU33_03060 [Phycisphaerales bacterium]|nr:hypothetical protein [Phycisphaerales bacterium]